MSESKIPEHTSRLTERERVTFANIHRDRRDKGLFIEMQHPVLN